MRERKGSVLESEVGELGGGVKVMQDESVDTEDAIERRGDIWRMGIQASWNTMSDQEC